MKKNAILSGWDLGSADSDSGNLDCRRQKPRCERRMFRYEKRTFPEYVNRHTGVPKKMFYYKGKKYKAVKGYEGLYYACNNGSVLRFSASDMMLHVVSLASDGVSLRLHKNGKHIYCRLDTLIADAFCRKCAGCVYVWHRDGNVYNSDPKNLKWVEDKPVYRKEERKRISFERMGIVLQQYETPKEASDAMGMSVNDVIDKTNTRFVASNGCYLTWVDAKDE